MGNDHHFFSSAREWFIPHLCSRSSFPPALDDLKNAHQLGDIALAYYDGSKDGTCAKEMEPKTCPLVTMNWGALYGLAQDYRVWFNVLFKPKFVTNRLIKSFFIYDQVSFEQVSCELLMEKIIL